MLLVRARIGRKILCSRGRVAPIIYFYGALIAASSTRGSDRIGRRVQGHYRGNHSSETLAEHERFFQLMYQLLDKTDEWNWQNCSPLVLLENRQGGRRERARRAFEDRLYRSIMGMPRDPPWKLLAALLTEQGYLKRFIRRRLGRAAPIDTFDRQMLEQIIFPGYLADPGIRRVLFVGCDNYTAHYEPRFFASHDYWTIEPDPKMRRYGSTRHVVAPLEQLTDYFRPGFFNLIICNGVYGWGLDTAEQCETAFANCHTCLGPGGHLLIGWDDIAPRRPAVLLPEIASLRWFDKVQFSALGSCRYVTDTPYRHIYEFYQRPC
jgi:hypothetical protein